MTLVARMRASRYRTAAIACMSAPLLRERDENIFEARAGKFHVENSFAPRETGEPFEHFGTINFEVLSLGVLGICVSVG